MLEIIRHETDPYFNIAAEEYFIRNFSEEFFMLWVNSPAVISGKHQNVFAETNLEFLSRNNIPVIRRITGGGTVYHDKGNLNYTLILNGKDNKPVNYRKYTLPVILALEKLGIHARLHGKSDLVISELKFSGNAMHVFKNRVIHHGTLLFSTNLDHLREAIRSSEDEFLDKAVRSNRSHVTNISEHLRNSMSFNEFREFFSDFLKDYFKSKHSRELNQEDIPVINDLVEKKYRQWEWNYGYSPPFEKKIQYFSHHQKISLAIRVKNGIIEEIIQETKPPAWLDELNINLKKKRFHPEDIENTLNSCKFAEALNPKAFINELFYTYKK